MERLIKYESYPVLESAPPRIDILNATNRYQLDSVRSLIRTFVGWHRQRHHEDLALINEYFDEVAFEEELATLPGKYASPKGRLLLALLDGQRAGCGALRQIDAQTCEMKRMFVYPQFQGRGVGRALAETLIREAKVAGYSTIRLDTSFRQTEAIHLYQSLGFQRIDPYYEVSTEMQNWLVFMELSL
jgi:GNAT superfamily N-acetyltransferase